MWTTYIKKAKDVHHRVKRIKEVPQRNQMQCIAKYLPAKKQRRLIFRTFKINLTILYFVYLLVI